MSHEVEIHKAQTQILRELLFVDKAGFAKLQKPTKLTSDHFKFHIKRLVELGYVEKLPEGDYRLTTVGKEYANKLDTDSRTLERQPKCAVILVVERPGNQGETQFLVQERLKHPYFGFWGFPGGKIRWGETIVQAAARELHEETGLSADLTHKGVYHEHVIEKESSRLLEDKIFHVFHGGNIQGELVPSFDSGNNAWMTLPQVLAKEHRYASFDIEAEVGLGKQAFAEAIQYYSVQEF
jgi:8-oxo-dGTP pyrophosphatase MutT (NUDIX family)